MRYTYENALMMTGWDASFVPVQKLTHLSPACIEEMKVLYVLSSDIGEEVGLRHQGRTRQLVKDPILVSTTAGRETLNTFVALESVETLVGDTKPFLTLSMILHLHGSLMKGIHPDAGMIRRSVTYTTRESGRYFYISPNSCEQELQGLIDNTNINIDKNLSLKEKFEVSAEFFVRFLTIHPFSDGNGRVARLVVNYLLWSSLGIPFRIPSEIVGRETYLDAVSSAQPAPGGTVSRPHKLLKLLIEGAGYSVGTALSFERMLGD